MLNILIKELISKSIFNNITNIDINKFIKDLEKCELDCNYIIKDLCKHYNINDTNIIRISFLTDIFIISINKFIIYDESYSNHLFILSLFSSIVSGILNYIDSNKNFTELRKIILENFNIENIINKYLDDYDYKNNDYNMNIRYDCFLKIKNEILKNSIKFFLIYINRSIDEIDILYKKYMLI